MTLLGTVYFCYTKTGMQRLIEYTTWIVHVNGSYNVNTPTRKALRARYWSTTGWEWVSPVKLGKGMAAVLGSMCPSDTYGRRAVQIVRRRQLRQPLTQRLQCHAIIERCHPGQQRMTARSLQFLREEITVGEG